MVGRVEIAGVPWVGNASPLAGKFEQQADLSRRVAARDTLDPPHVRRVHRDDPVPVRVIGVRKLHRRAPLKGDAHLKQLSARAAVHVISDLLAADRARRDLEPFRVPALPYDLLHHKLRHRAAADIAVADEKHSYHILKSS